jgi:hypothetical protein
VQSREANFAKRRSVGSEFVGYDGNYLVDVPEIR